MIRTLDLRGSALDDAELGAVIPRPEGDVSRASAAASDLIGEVRERGSAALLDHAERFDGVRPVAIRVSAAQLAEALDGLDARVRDALGEAISRVRAVSEAQLPSPTSTTLGVGAVVEQRWSPVRRAGVYVPGGKAVYPSSVVMNVVPAQVAGVGSIVLASPAQKQFGGSIHPTILAAAAM